MKILKTFLFYCFIISFRCQISHSKCDGTCGPIKDCQLFLNLLRDKGTRNTDSLNLLRKATCGFRERTPLVCCPPAPINKSTSTRISPERPTKSAPRKTESLLPEFCGHPLSNTRGFGGERTQFREHPWAVALGYRERGRTKIRYDCGGSIISSRYVLTAAHCVHKETLGKKILVEIRPGEWDLSREVDCERRGRLEQKCVQPIVAGYDEITIHPDFDTRSYYSDDIALIRLNMTLNFYGDDAYLHPICIPSDNLDVNALIGGLSGIAVGWGLTEHGNTSNVLLKMTIPIVDDAECEEIYKEKFVTKQICAGGNGSTDTCLGDSGGPLIHFDKYQKGKFEIALTQIGIISFGPFPCAIDEFPGVYVDVKAYKPWILESLKPIEFKRCEGTCGKISECPHFAPFEEFLRAGRNFDAINEATCGFRDNFPLVCCTSKTKPAMDVHANEKLLPTCGIPVDHDSGKRSFKKTNAALGQYPWIAALGYINQGQTQVKVQCSGTIINSRYVLTAAQCVDPVLLGKTKLAEIRFGEWDLSSEIDCEEKREGTTCSSPTLRAGYEEILTHPDANKRSQSSDDIALIRLNITLNFDKSRFIQPICLPSFDLDTDSLIGKTFGTAVGWGTTIEGKASNILQKVSMPFVEHKLCEKIYRTEYIGNQLCVGGEEGIDTCTGDSGGPLMYRESNQNVMVQVGIISFGSFPCYLKNNPGVYVDVKAYKNWILENLKP